MKNRNIPCTECRKHRRKCIRTLSDICDRCERLGKLCMQSTQTVSQYSDSEDIGVDQLQQQVEQLEWTIRQMEDQMKLLSCRSNNETSLTQLSKSNRSPMYEDMMKSLVCNWKFKIKNGTFQIETGIRNVSDLLPFQLNPSIPYLSPMGSYSSSSSVSSFSTGSEFSFDDTDSYRGIDSGIVVHFGRKAKSGVPFTVSLLTKCIGDAQSDPATLSLPSTLLLDPFVIVDQLIDIYFCCQNVYQPMIHQKTFMEKYRQLIDPFTDSVCISLCCFVCASPCEHFPFSSKERRNMADFFYAKAKLLILDQFDDYDKRLDNVISINLLAKHMHMTLRFKECKRLISIAYQIILDLQNEYNYNEEMCYTKGTNYSKYITDSLSKASDNVGHVLFTRHVTVTLCVRRLMDFLSNTAIDDTCFHFPFWLHLEDEPKLTKQAVESQNWVIAFFDHPFIAAMMVEIYKVHIGQVCALTFESIVRLEDVINEWSVMMPEKFRLSPDMRNEQICMAAIDEADDFLKLLSFVHFHIFLVGIYSCLLQPVALGSENDQLLSFIQQHSLEDTLKSCRLIINAVHRMSRAKGNSNCHYRLAALDFLYHSIDVLIMLALSPNPHVANESRINLVGCLDKIDSMEFMQEHRVAKDASPINLGIIDFNDPSSFHLKYYDQYPQPWFAMIYDASHYIASLQ